MKSANAFSPLASEGRLSGQPLILRRLHRLQRELRTQCRQGWDLNAMLRVHSELASLADVLTPVGASAIREQLLALRTALTPAVTRGRVPDRGMTALLAALSDNLGQLLPENAPDTQVDVAQPMPEEAPQAKSRVLVVGLSQEQAERLLPTLQAQSDLEVLHVPEPLAVLEELSRFEPHLVALNLDMSVCESADLAGMIREREDCANLPIVFLASADAAETGVSDIISMAQESAALVAELKRHLDAPEDARGPTDLRDPERAGQDRRAWLLDRLNAALTSTQGRRGGLLEIGIDKLDALQRENLPSELRDIHRQLGQLISQSLEAGDLLAETSRGYLVLCRERTIATLRALGEELLGNVRRERFGSQALPLSVSIGGCALGDDLDQVDAVLNAAWRARRAAGAGQIGWHHRGDGRLEARDLESALREQRMHLVHQAIVRLTGGGMPQYQALLRLRDSDGFVHSAAEVLPVAREAGLIPRLDQWSLEEGLRLLADQQRQMRSLRLFISQSSEVLHECDYPAYLGERLRHYGVRGTRLVLDFACDDISESPRELIRVAPRIRDLGAGLSLSGIHRGLRAAQLLDALPLEFVKLAPNLNRAPGAMVPVAHAREIAVIATQIEEESQLRALREAGVDYAQGHTLAHPSRSLNYRFADTPTGAKNRRA